MQLASVSARQRARAAFAAPGNIVRMALYPAGGKLLPSIESAILLFLGCTFIAWFAAYYATGEILALRARNEVFVMIVISLTCSVMLLSQMIGQ
jgi:hypothetical protein